ncbi:MAG: hypothetical protein JSS49_19160 [Planctomycetes bacterium]|nr:hypothetical protein [Planctomycetota bacterium]
MQRWELLFALVAMGLVAGSAKADEAPAKSGGKKTPVKSSETPKNVSSIIEHPVPSTAPATPLSRQRRQRHQQWERALQVPAELNVGDRESITLGALLDQIRQKHGLHVQIDLPHVLPIAAAFDLPGQKSQGGKSGSLTAVFTHTRRHANVPNAGLLPPTSPDPFPRATPAYPTPAYPTPTYRPSSPSPELPSIASPADEIRTNRPQLNPYGEDAISPVSVAPSADPPVVESVEPIKPKVTKKAKKSADKSTVGKKPEKSDPKPAETGDDDQDPQASALIATATTTLLELPVAASVVTQPNATVEDVLRQAFDQALPLQTLVNAEISEELPLLASLTQATEWDLLVQDHGVLVTTRLNANLQKQTRVYSVRMLEQSAKLKSEDVARIITRTIRPWSWKKHFPDANTASQAATPASRKTSTGKKISVPKVNLDMLGLLFSSASAVNQRIRLVSDDSSSESSGEDSASEKVEITEEDLALVGQAWDGLFQTAVISLQVIYHADPPTGIVEVLPGMLIISQSQGAHREIADLLEQLSNPEN